MERTEKPSEITRLQELLVSKESLEISRQLLNSGRMELWEILEVIRQPQDWLFHHSADRLAQSILYTVNSTEETWEGPDITACLSSHLQPSIAGVDPSCGATEILLDLPWKESNDRLAGAIIRNERKLSPWNQNEWSWICIEPSGNNTRMMVHSGSNDIRFWIERWKKEAAIIPGHESRFLAALSIAKGQGEDERRAVIDTVLRTCRLEHSVIENSLFSHPSCDITAIATPQGQRWLHWERYANPLALKTPEAPWWIPPHVLQGWSIRPQQRQKHHRQNQLYVPELQDLGGAYNLLDNLGWSNFPGQIEQRPSIGYAPRWQ